MITCLLTACSPAKALEPARLPEVGSNAKEQPVVLEWLVEPTQISDKYKQYITDPFTAKNPSIKINIVPTADYDRVTRTRLAAGEGPDLFNQDNPAVASDYWDNGQLLDLSKYASLYKWREKLLPWAYQAAVSNGRMFTLPTEFETSCMLYNADMFEKNGWKVPESLDDFTRLCDEIENKDIQPIALGTRDNKSPYRWLSTGILTAMANSDVVEVLQGKKNLTDPAIKKGFELQLDLYRRGYFGRNFIQLSLDDSKVMFAKGRSAMIFGGCFFFGDMNKLINNNFRWNWFQLNNWAEGGTGGSPYPIAIGEVLSINAKTKHPDQAAKFADFFIDDKSDAINHIVGANGYYMVPIALKPSDYSGRLLPQVENVYAAMDEAMKKNEAGYAMWGCWPYKTATYIKDYFERVYTGDLTLDEYLAGAQKVLDDDRANKKIPKLFFDL